MFRLGCHSDMYDALPTYPEDGTGVHVLSLTDALIAESRSTWIDL